MLYFKSSFYTTNYKEITDQEVKSFLTDIKKALKTSIANNDTTNTNS